MIRDDDVASTGISVLDEALGGLYRGDNVVFEVATPGAAQPFYAAVAAAPTQYHTRLFVSLDAEAEVPPGFARLDARPGGTFDQPAPLLHGIVEHCLPGQRNLVMFQTMETMIARWGAAVTGRFFARCCPQLLELGAIAYWSAPSGELYSTLRRTIEDVTQCILVVDDTRLRIAKAEGRAPGVEGSVFRYSVDAGGPSLTPAPVVARVGSALRAARSARGISQAELARLAGVSPSAISQAERGKRGLSLETLLELTGNLNMTLDELLRGQVVAGYRLGRRRDPSSDADGQIVNPLPLLDDRATGLRAYLVRLAPGQSGRPQLPHKGLELVAVASGLVQVILGDGRPVMRAGDVLLIEKTTIEGWRNLGHAEATLFRILRD
jgi:transcriptional regulator with XRE-family HTH domain